MNIQCLKCKGRGFCGRSFCPIYAKANSVFRIKSILSSAQISEEFSSKAPSVLVGRNNYPNINVGIMAPPEIPSLFENAELYDSPRTWAEKNLQIDRIIELRSALINSSFRAYVSSVRSSQGFFSQKLLELSQEIGMASKPVDVEISVEEKPKFRISLDPYVAPFGPSAKLKKAELTANPHVNPIIEKTVFDYDFKASDAMTLLFQRGFDENVLTKLLSVGALGVKTERKLVPTRWAITATDDSIGKRMIDNIKDFPETNYLSFFGSYLGNYYLVLLFPEKWSYELFETYMPKAEWNQTDEIQFMTDFEPYSGRKTYAENCAGGYYAARLPILEKFSEMKRQASVLCIRIITGEYFCPLGVWVVREAVRKTMASKPIEFSDRELMLKYARALLKKKFGMNADDILNKSILLRNLKTQTKLRMFA